MYHTIIFNFDKRYFSIFIASYIYPSLKIVYSNIQTHCTVTINFCKIFHCIVYFYLYLYFVIFFTSIVLNVLDVAIMSSFKQRLYFRIYCVAVYNTVFVSPVRFEQGDLKSQKLKLTSDEKQPIPLAIRTSLISHILTLFRLLSFSFPWERVYLRWSFYKRLHAICVK